MSGTGRKRPPLVADKRPRAQAKRKPTPKAKTPPPGGRRPGARRRKAAPRQRRGPLGLLVALVGWFLRLIWKTVLAGTAAVAVIVGLATYTFYSQLPPMGDLLDGRTRGSVTLLDRNGDVFAWRGDQFLSLIHI